MNIEFNSIECVHTDLYTLLNRPMFHCWGRISTFWNYKR